MSSSKPWYVYMLRCCDNSLYTGVTTDLERRVAEHNSGKKAAKYTRVRRPVTLAYAEQQESRVRACKREYQLKQLTKKEKELLVTGQTSHYSRQQ